MPRWISILVSAIALLGLLSSGAYVLARWYAHDRLAVAAAGVLKIVMPTLGVLCAYAMCVGIYHVFLSVTGLDRARPRKPRGP